MIDDDNEDFEDDVQALIDEVRVAANDAVGGSEEKRLLSTLLLKVRGFIAKASYFTSVFHHYVFHPTCHTISLHFSSTLDGVRLKIRLYYGLVFFFLIGALCPLIAYLISLKWPNFVLRYIK